MNERQKLYDILLIILSLVLVYFGYSFWSDQYKVSLEEKTKLSNELSIKKEYTEIQNIAEFNKKISEFTPPGDPKENILSQLSEIERKSGAKIIKLEVKEGVVKTDTKPESEELITEDIPDSDTPVESNIVEPVKELKFLESQVEIQIAGRFGSINSFVQYLEENSRIMDIIQFNYTVQDKSDEIEATIIMKVYAK